MKAHHPRPVFRIPLAIGRSESDLTAKGADYAEQLHLFRDVLSRPAKIQVLAMMALSNPAALDKPSAARIADIADAMGYERDELPTGKRVFHRDLYQRIEEVGMRLRRREVELLVREHVRTVRDGRKTGATRRQYRTALVSMTVLQEFGFYYEDDDGQPMNLDALSASDQVALINVQAKAKKAATRPGLLKYDAVDGGQPIWAIPMLDDAGAVIRNADGTPRRRPANGLTWRWSSRFADLTRDQDTSWRMWLDAVAVLRQYLTKPVTFDLIWYSLFHKEGNIEISHDKLVDHLGIKGTGNRARVEAAIASAFDNLLTEGIIDQLPTVRDAGYYQPTKKTNRPRRVGKVYQWRVAKRWSTPSSVIDVTPTPPGPNPG